MKFGDKLIELRKKKGYSQEELAEKLGVSRQSVSKWESNNTYPETDKIIQIANLFDCSMDDLINDKVTDIESSMRKNKNNIYNVWDSLLEFITKTVNMFSKMKFSEGFKCVVEMLILCFLLSILGRIICGFTSSVILNIFSFLTPAVVSTIESIVSGVLYLIWFIVAVIALIHTFKIRYLNYYAEEKELKQNSSDDENSMDENEKIVENKVTRNEKPFEFLGSLSKIIIIFIKFIAFFILLGTVGTAIGLVIGDVLAISLVFTHTIFLWITLLLVAATIVSIQVIILLISFIFDRKIKITRHIIIFISCVIISGISVGLLALTIKDIEVVDSNKIFNLEAKEISIDYKNDLVIESNGLGLSSHYKYIIDNNMENNKITVSREIDPKYFELHTYNTTMDQLPVIKVEENSKNDLKTLYNLFINNIKQNKVFTFNEYGNDPLVIKANEETVNHLIENLEKLYLLEKNINGNEINIITHLDRVYFENGLEGEYNANDDSIKYDVEDYICTKKIEKTEFGDRIVYTCDYAVEDGE